jgi:hypothetical protein
MRRPGSGPSPFAIAAMAESNHRNGTAAWGAA